MAATPVGEARSDSDLDLELAPVLAVLWLASLGRVALGLAHSETFGVESTLALLAVLLVPFLMKDALVWCLRR